MDEREWNESECVSNLLLQMLLYFNVYGSMLWATLLSWHIYNNINDFGQIHAVFIVIGYIVLMFGESLRLFLGYSGNLRGKVQDLAGFWIITTLIVLPIHIYLAFVLNLEKLIAWILYIEIIFLVLEIPTATFASHKLSNHLTKLYRLKILSNLDKSK